MQQTFKDRDEYTEAPGYLPVERVIHAGQKRDRCGSKYFDDFDSFENALRGAALAVVPIDLIFQTAVDGVRFRIGRKGRLVDRVLFWHQKGPMKSWIKFIPRARR
jgi:hypothetical protein